MRDDNTFSPSSVDLKGRILAFDNRGAVVHNFSIKDVDVEDSDLEPGTSLAVTLVVIEGGRAKRVPPGTYEFFCKYHVDQGMKGTLIIS